MSKQHDPATNDACAQFHEHLDALTTGEAPAASLRTLLGHAVACEACATSLRLQLVFRERALRSAAEDVPGAVVDDLLGALEPTLQAPPSGASPGALTPAEAPSGRSTSSGDALPSSPPRAARAWFARPVRGLAAASIALALTTAGLAYEVVRLRREMPADHPPAAVMEPARGNGSAAARRLALAGVIDREGRMTLAGARARLARIPGDRVVLRAGDIARLRRAARTSPVLRRLARSLGARSEVRAEDLVRAIDDLGTDLDTTLPVSRLLDLVG
ncbi:MAG: hypothetical protein D6701_07310 [Gemmatimonadetes bacterium]|nr:MAG: hypothetical protein D6701_07310 [Gemmatimonadota bacterium]